MKNLTELYNAIKSGHVSLNAELPVFGGDEPKNTMMVWSWDEKHVLYGASVDSLRVLTRDELAERREQNKIALQMALLCM